NRRHGRQNPPGRNGLQSEGPECRKNSSRGRPRTERATRLMAGATREGGRLTAVDALRGLAALAVLAIHVPHVRPPQGGRKQLLFLPAEYGTQGVTLFLVISGFCIHLGAARALARGAGARCDWAAFWRRRFRRLYPP